MGLSILLFSVVGVLGIATMARSQKSANPQDEQQLRKIEAVTAQFEQQNDSSKMDLLGDDWVSAGNGKVISENSLRKT